MAPLGTSSGQLTLSLDGGSAHGAASGAAGGNEDEPMAQRAARIVVENQLGSTSMIQRQLKLGYARAGRIMDMLEEMGVVARPAAPSPARCSCTTSSRLRHCLARSRLRRTTDARPHDRGHPLGRAAGSSACRSTGWPMTTKLQPRMIDAFERSDFDEMPPKGYAQATLASYARYLGLDPNEILPIYEEQLYRYQRESDFSAHASRSSAIAAMSVIGSAVAPRA